MNQQPTRTAALTPSIRSGQRTHVSRREFLAAGVATAVAVTCLPAATRGEERPATIPRTDDGIPLLDLHVHLDKSTIDQVLEISRERGVTFGIVEHAGTKENEYPVVLSNDDELGAYLDRLEGKPVFTGVQAEWIDWSSGFSREALARLDYVLMDTMTFPGKDGQRIKLWEADVAERVEMSDKQEFMDRYVQWYVDTIEKQPIDVLANVSWLPKPLSADYETYWTPARIRRVVEAAARHQVAIEIGSYLRLPKLYFLELAKSAGVKFSFGTNGRYPRMGQLDHCLATAQALRLNPSDMFTPAPDGQKAIQRRLGV